MSNIELIRRVLGVMARGVGADKATHSATSLAEELGEPADDVHFMLQRLDGAGLVGCVEQRVTERQSTFRISSAGLSYLRHVSACAGVSDENPHMFAVPVLVYAYCVGMDEQDARLTAESAVWHKLGAATLDNEKDRVVVVAEVDGETVDMTTVDFD